MELEKEVDSENFNKKSVIISDDDDKNIFVKILEMIMAQFNKKQILLEKENQEKEQKKLLQQQENEKRIKAEADIRKEKARRAEQGRKEAAEARVISEKIDGFIKAQMLGLVLKAQKNGYELTDEQTTNFNSVLLEMLAKDNTEVLESMINDNHKISSNLLVQWLINSPDSQKTENFILEKIGNKFEEKGFCENLLAYVGWDIIRLARFYNVKGLSPDAAYQYANSFLKENNKLLSLVCDDLFEKIEKTIKLEAYLNFFNTKDESAHLINSFRNYNNRNVYNDQNISINLKEYDRLINKINFQLNNNFKDEEMQFLEEIKRKHVKEVVEKKVIEKRLSHVNDKVLVELPKNTNELLNEIENKVKLCLDDNQLPIEKKTIIEKLYSERVPEIVSTYVSIVPAYRETLFNTDKKKPAELMNESLIDVKEILEKILVEINQSKVDSLSANQRYTSNVKNSI